MQDIMAYDQAHYFGDATGENITLGGVVTELTESSNPTESEKQYIHEKSSRTNVTGFANEFPITMDMVKGDAVFEDYLFSVISIPKYLFEIAARVPSSLSCLRASLIAARRDSEDSP